jgi:ribosomal protein S18 acetylase RimI-like enzyme
MSIVAIRQASEELLAAINSLIPQVSSSAGPLSLGDLNDLINREGTTLFVAQVEGRTVGMLTLVTFVIPTGTRAWIEDVVVDTSVRGRGLGKQLVEKALEEAKSAGATTVDLTSRPAREAANALYHSLGFELRETNLYRFSFDD